MVAPARGLADDALEVVRTHDPKKPLPRAWTGSTYSSGVGTDGMIDYARSRSKDGRRFSRTWRRCLMRSSRCEGATNGAKRTVHADARQCHGALAEAQRNLQRIRADADNCLWAASVKREAWR